MIVIVTGASGYIGGVISLKLKDAGYNVIGLDRRPCPDQLKLCFDQFIESDFVDSSALQFIADTKADVIIHCAGNSLVGPSMTDPEEYYHNNIVKTLSLLDTIVKYTPDTRIIFSSSAAVYGVPIMSPCNEVDPCEPISPYGESKLAIEWFLRSYNRAYNLDYVAFRYFNAAGADSQGRHGQEPGDTHIIARVLESIKNKTEFTLYGNNYETPDGTCIRDYVHVEDVALAHIAAFDKKVPAGVYNIGTNRGVSNLEICNEAEAITGVKFPIAFKDKRPGDPAMLVGETDKFQKVAGWRSKYTLRDIINHAWTWYNQ
jgi:UDP-glucose 4-epimerase